MIFLGLYPMFLSYILGIFMWTFIEYVLHRFVFHFTPTSNIGRKIHFLLHGLHHYQPMVKTRLVMPPILSLMIASVFYVIYSLLFSHMTKLIYAGTLTGYLLYDMCHYYIHFGGAGTYMRKRHYAHHRGKDHANFGVTSPLWDYVFCTNDF